jgi:hypothetical protein
MNRRKFIYASTLTSAGIIVSPLMKGKELTIGNTKNIVSKGTQVKQTIKLQTTDIPDVQS